MLDSVGTVITIKPTEGRWSSTSQTETVSDRSQRRSESIVGRAISTSDVSRLVRSQRLTRWATTSSPMSLRSSVPRSSRSLRGIHDSVLRGTASEVTKEKSMGIRPKLTRWLGVSLVAGATALALALPATSASALTIPSPPTCSSTNPGPGIAPTLTNATNQPGLPPHCWYLPESGTEESPGGAAAGYLGADDGHTKYRFVQTTFPVTPQMIDLNSSVAGGLQGAVGVEECDPNIAYAAQFGVVWDTAPADAPAHWVPFYAQGHWNSLTGDPCISHSLLVTAPNITTCPPNGAGPVLGTSPGPVFCGSFSNTVVSTNDVLSDVGIYYTPGGSHFHQVSFGFCDVTAGYCRQAYAPSKITLNFWEIGVGVFSGNQLLAAPAGITLVPFSNTGMNCYSCSPGPRDLSVIQPVNSNGVGGLEQVSDVNGSGQDVLSPNNTLVGGSFTMFNGSTSP